MVREVKRIAVRLTAAWVLALAGGVAVSATVQAQELPIADLHMHAFAKSTPADIKQRMDRNGVRWAGLGARTSGGGSRKTWEEYSAALGDRWIAFAGQSETIVIYKNDGVAGLEDANNSGFLDFIREAEDDLKAGRVKGIGEVHINNRRTSPVKWFRRKARADASSFRVLLKLVSKYNAVLAVHMEADSDSVAQFESLLGTDRRGRVILLHCGVQAKASLIRSLFEKYPNLFCELAIRYPPARKPQSIYGKIFDMGGIEQDWQTLIEDYPDRFMVGTDITKDDKYDKAIEVVRMGLLAHLTPNTARKVAYENAQRLFNLK